MEQMHEISFKHVNDGSIRLEQQSGVDEPNMIWLHPEQLKYITRRICGMDSATAASIKDLERKLSILSAGLERFVCDADIRAEILDQCGNGPELINRLHGILILAREYDGARLTPKDLHPAFKPAYGRDVRRQNANPQAKQTNAAKHKDEQLLEAAV